MCWRFVTAASWIFRCRNAASCWNLESVAATFPDPLRLSVALDAQPAQLITAVRDQGLEGIVAKRLTNPYLPGQRIADWTKLRISKGQELVIWGLHTLSRYIRFAARRILRRREAHFHRE